MSLTELQFQSWLASFFWPFLRVGAVFMSAPLFSSRQVPLRWRVLLAALLTLVLVPLIPPVPVIEVFGPQAVAVAVGELLIGLAMGAVLQMVFSAMVLAGQVVANKMGLGFAQMVDPQNGIQVPVLSQYYLIISTFLFMMLNGHLLIIDLLAQSFQTLPVAGEGLGRAEFHAVVAWGSRMFSASLLVALPAVGALMLVNLSFGVIARAAPQLHIFAIGFPISILVGFAAVWLSLPNSLDVFTEVLDEAFLLLKEILAIRT